MNKLLPCILAGLLTACSFGKPKSYKFTDYFPDADITKLDRWDRGILETYQPPMITVKLQCDSILPILASDTINNIWDDPNKRERLIFNSKTIAEAETRQDIVLTQQWLEYIDDVLDRYNYLGTYLNSALTADDFNEFQHQAQEMRDRCTEFISITEAFINSLEPFPFSRFDREIAVSLVYDEFGELSPNYEDDVTAKQKRSAVTIKADSDVLYFVDPNYTVALYARKGTTIYLDVPESVVLTKDTKQPATWLVTNQLP